MFPELQQLSTKLRQIDQLMNRARSINFNAGSIEAGYQRLFPQSVNISSLVANARAQLDASVTAFRQTMSVQAPVASNVAADGATLQAANQLLALVAKQQLQIQNLMAAQYRADTLEAARRAQAEDDAREATRPRAAEPQDARRAVDTPPGLRAHRMRQTAGVLLWRCSPDDACRR